MAIGRILGIGTAVIAGSVGLAKIGQEARLPHTEELSGLEADFDDGVEAVTAPFVWAVELVMGKHVERVRMKTPVGIKLRREKGEIVPYIDSKFKEGIGHPVEVSFDGDQKITGKIMDWGRCGEGKPCTNSTTENHYPVFIELEVDDTRGDIFTVILDQNMPKSVVGEGFRSVSGSRGNMFENDRDFNAESQGNTTLPASEDGYEDNSWW